MPNAPENRGPILPHTRLEKIRRTAGYTQRSLAAVIGTSHVAVGTWERGAVRPRPLAGRRLAITLGVPVDELLLGERPRKRGQPRLGRDRLNECAPPRARGTSP